MVQIFETFSFPKEIRS